jgi:hypothetical protein
MKLTLRMLTIAVLAVAGFSISPTLQAQGPAYFVMPTPFAPPAITAPNGGASISVIHVIPLNGFTGTISFTCAVNGGHPPLPMCVTPPPVKVTPGGTGSFTTYVLVTSTKLTPTATYFVSVTAKSDKGLGPTFAPVAFPLDIRHEFVVGGGD